MDMPQITEGHPIPRFRVSSIQRILVFTLAGACIIAGLTYGVRAARKTVADFTLPAQEQLDLERLQSKAFLAQRDYQAAQQAFQTSFASYTAKAEELRAEHVKADGWAPAVQFDPNTATFRIPPNTPTTPAPATTSPGGKK